MKTESESDPKPKLWNSMRLYTPPKFNSSPLKSSLPNRKGSSSNHHFSGVNELLNFGAVNELFFNPINLSPKTTGIIYFTPTQTGKNNLELGICNFFPKVTGQKWIIFPRIQSKGKHQQSDGERNISPWDSNCTFAYLKQKNTLPETNSNSP